MATNDEPYLKCRGLPRLLLHSVVYVLRNAEEAETVPVSSVLEHAKVELEGRGELSPPSTEMEQALAELPQTGWVEENHGRLALTDEGWRAHGQTDRHQPPTLQSKDPEPSLADGTIGVLSILLEVLEECESGKTRYWLDPRVNPQGEILVENLRQWAAWLGFPNKIFEQAVAVLVRHGLVLATDVGPDCPNSPLPEPTPWSHLLLRASDEVAREAATLDVRSIVSLITVEEAAQYEAADVEASAARYIAAHEIRANERLNRVPNKEARDRMASIRRLAQDPPYGVTLGSVLQHLVNAFPGIDVEPLRESGTRSWEVPEQVLNAIRVAAPHVHDDEITEYFSVYWFPAKGVLGEAIKCLFEEGKVRVAEFHAIKDGVYEGAHGPVLRLSLQRHDWAWDRQPPLTGEPFVPTRDDLAILGALASRRQCWTQVDLVEFLCTTDLPLSRNNIGPRLKVLKAHGYVGYPQGERKGAAITDLGLKLLSADPN